MSGLISSFTDYLNSYNAYSNMIAVSQQREAPFGVSVVMVYLFFGVNFLLFLYFQVLKTAKQQQSANDKTDLITTEEGGHVVEKGKAAGGHQKELSKPFTGTLDCYINLTSELFRLGLILLMTYVCEYLWFFRHSTKTYSRDLFIFVLIIFFGYAFYTIKPVKDLSLLGREQTEEWKGWMQFIFLLYHYFHAEEVYNPVRVMITCYVWMTGFGNFSFFYLKGDYTWLRVVQMLWRLNFSVILLMWTHQNTWILYYICPMHTFYFMMVYVTMYIFSSINTTKWAIRWKLLILGIIIFIVWDYNNGLFDILFQFLGTEKVIGASSGSVWEWYFRTSLDHWSTYLGMIFALNFPLCEQFFTKAKGPPLYLASVLMGALTLYWFYYYYPLEKLEYNLTHSYFAIIPLTSYIFFRNLTPYIRSGVSMSLHELGKTTLETYLLQHHIWLSSNAKTLWTVTPGNPWINFAIATMIFFIVSKELYRLTMSLRGMVLPDDKNIALTNIIGLVVLTFAVYALAFAISSLGFTPFAIAIVCVGLSMVTLFLIGRFLPTNDQHFFQLYLNRSLKYLGFLFAVLVFTHLIFYRGTSSEIISASNSLTPGFQFGNTKECLHSISHGTWASERCDTPTPQAAASAAGGAHVAPVIASNDPYQQTTAYCVKHEWKWITSKDSPDMKFCPISKLSSKIGLQVFQNKKILFLGDSILRSTYHGFLNVLDSNYTQNHNADLKHSNLQHFIPKSNLSVEFRWTPFLQNITTELQSMTNNKDKTITTNYHYIVFGSILWDALYFHDVTAYGRELQRMLNYIRNWKTNDQMVRVWLMPTTVLDERLITEEKRKFMNQQEINKYRQLIYKTFDAQNANATTAAQLLMHNVIDGETVSKLRESSSTDGIHFSEDIYTVLGQMLLNNYYLHYPKFFVKGSATATKKPYTPRTTGSMSFPGYGMMVLVTAAIMLFTMDSFFGIGYISLLIFGRSFDWEAGYGPLHRKIHGSSGGHEKEERSNNSSSDKKQQLEQEIVPLMEKEPRDNEA